jgi:phosphotriesterase-related protein
MKISRLEASGLTRREATRLLTMGVGLAVAAGCRKGADPARAGNDPKASTSASATPSFAEGAVIRTVLNDVPPAASGTKATLFHEHLQLGVMGYYSSPPKAGAREKPPTAEETEQFLTLAVEELRLAAADGVGCIVDAAIGRRSDWELDNLKQMATRSGVQVVVAGGYFKAPYPDAIAKMSEGEIADHLTGDASVQRWGAFGEIGTSMKMHPDERKFLRALSQAHVRTGLPIFTHVEHHGCASCALEQLDLFESQGVNPAHLCIGHLSDITQKEDPHSDTHKAIARRGAFVGFDTVGRALAGAAPGTPGKLADFDDIPDRDKARRVLSLLDAGFEDQVLLSSDFSSPFDLKANWGGGYSSAVLNFVPKLRHAKVDEATIRKILVDNPRRFLAFVPSSSA